MLGGLELSWGSLSFTIRIFTQIRRKNTRTYKCYFILSIWIYRISSGNHTCCKCPYLVRGFSQLATLDYQRISFSVSLRPDFSEIGCTSLMFCRTFNVLCVVGYNLFNMTSRGMMGMECGEPSQSWPYVKLVSGKSFKSSQKFEIILTRINWFQ